MKKITLLLLAFVALVFSGCSKYGFVKLNYPVAPVVVLPENVKTIAVVNRSLTKAHDKKNKIAEAVKTAEIAGSDKLASDECLKGVFDRIHGVRGFSIVIPSHARLYGTGTRETPELLDWKTVQAICDSTGADALLVLETFDSNTDLILSTVSNQVNTVLNGGIPKPSLPSQVRMTVMSYWRLYNPATKAIIDQYQTNSTMTFDGVGQDFRLLPPEALPNAAYAAGQECVERFLPSYYSVKRDMYKKGKGSSKQAFKVAFRRAEVANWDGAIEKWKEIQPNANNKNAGKACLNIAVGYEVLGNTDQALLWAKKAYEDYGNKLAREYANILLRRKSVE